MVETIIQYKFPRTPLKSHKYSLIIVVLIVCHILPLIRKLNPRKPVPLKEIRASTNRISSNRQISSGPTHLMAPHSSFMVLIAHNILLPRRNSHLNSAQLYISNPTFVKTILLRLLRYPALLLDRSALLRVLLHIPHTRFIDFGRSARS